MLRATLDYKRPSTSKNSLKDYEKALKTFGSNGDFLIDYSDALSKSGQYKKAIEVLKTASNHLNTTIVQMKLGNNYKTLGLFKHAENCYLSASAMTPGKFYPIYFLAKLYDESNQPQKAKATATILLSMPIKIESIEITMMKMNMKEIINK